MPRYAALLRGINVGRSARIGMTDLRALLGQIGYSDVATYLQSGNAVFTCPHARPEVPAREVEGALRERLGISVRCLIRDRDELQAVIAGNPLAGVATDGARFLAFFLSDNPRPELLAARDPAALDPERIRLGDRVLYQWCPDGVLAAPAVGAFVEKHLGVTVTARNWNTVTRLAAMLEA